MALTDKQIHRIELLITLDYLLNFTDEEHPATQQKICRYATEFGLKYDSTKTSGNEVKRQRIKESLDFLKEISDKFSDKVPFIIETTDSGKYYVEQKFYLSEEQVIKIIAAIKNDKYTADEDTDFLIERILDNFANRFNRDRYLKEASNLTNNVKKFNKESDRKINLINQALKENKLICINSTRTVFNFRNAKNSKNTNHKYVETVVTKQWYKVYKIKEYQNKPWAILLQITTIGNEKQKIICEPIELLDIPFESNDKILIEDMADDRDINQWFNNISPFNKKHFGTIDEYIDQNILPTNGAAVDCSFYFLKKNLEYIKNSFESYFGTPLNYKLCADFRINKDVHVSKVFIMPTKLKQSYLIPIEGKNKSDNNLVIVNMRINFYSLKSWIISDDMINQNIEIVGPDSLNNELASYYLEQAIKYRYYLSDREKIEIIKTCSYKGEERKKTYSNTDFNGKKLFIKRYARHLK